MTTPTETTTRTARRASGRVVALPAHPFTARAADRASLSGRRWARVRPASAPLSAPLPANAAERWTSTMRSAIPVATAAVAEEPATVAASCVTGWQEARRRAAVTALAIATVLVLWHWVAAR